MQNTATATSTEAHPHSPVIVLPKLRAMARRGLPHIIEGTIIPLLVFYAVLWLLDVWWAVIGAMTWAYLALARRMFRKQRVGGILLITALTLTIRAALTFITGNVKLYFLQSSFAKFAVSGAFIGSVWLGEPLIKRIAKDFVDLPPELENHPVIKRCFVRITILWAAVLLAHSAVAIWLILSHSIETYVIAKTFVTWAFEGGAILASLAMARRTISRHGFTLSFG